MKINEIFHSIQGEGILIGIPTTFIRMTGCNLRCRWCDTRYAYDEGEEMAIPEILARVGELPGEFICITGGEPLLQDETTKLIEELCKRGYEVSLETNGSHSIEKMPCLDSLVISLDAKCPTSGMHGEMDFSNLELLGPNDQLKFIISDEQDYEYAKEMIVRYKPICSIIMTPVDGRELKDLTQWVLRDGLKVRVLPQLHKLIWGDVKGV